MAKMYRTPLWQRLLHAFVKSLNSVWITLIITWFTIIVTGG